VNFLLCSIFNHASNIFLQIEKKMIAEYCAFTEHTPGEQSYTAHQQLKIEAIRADKFPLLGQDSCRLDKVVSFRTIMIA
jgi:hypothetical protein